MACASRAGAVTPYDPAYRYRTIHTEHFSIHFHQGEDALARRLAAIAEDVWTRLATPLGLRPPAHTEVVLSDWTEVSNGFATPVPYDTIVVTAAWPSGAEFIGKTDDWLRLVFSHEFTHIVHLDRSEGWARVVRRVFGRTAIAFPNLYLPQWQIEGLATYEESVLTGAGRLHAGDFAAIVDEAALQRRLEPIDRLNGGLTTWPTDYGAYAYGAGFHKYLADRFGQETLATLAASTARRVPFTTAAAFEQVYGRSLGTLWREYEDDAARQADRAAAGGTADRGVTRLTHHGYIVAGPRFDPSSCAGPSTSLRASCQERVVYSAVTLDEFPALYTVSMDGAPPTRLAERYLGSSTGFSGQMVYFDQLELWRNSGLYSDLYALERTTGHVTRLTDEARLLDLDVSPDGKTLVAVHSAPGRRDLVVANLDRGSVKPTILMSEAETQFNWPRWSPDGRSIAAERHRPGHESEIVIVDRDTRAVRVIASDSDARFVTPAWRPDGRAILAAADFRDRPFNLYEISIDSTPGVLRQLTHTTGGATSPDVSADGKSIVYAGYTVDGFDVFTMPYPAADGVSEPVVRSEASTSTAERDLIASPDAATREEPSPVSPYNPLATLKPTTWFPVIESDSNQVRIGAGTSGVDVLGYHAYVASASWLTSGSGETSIANRAIPNWDVTYAYQRWRPTLLLSTSRTVSSFAGGADSDGRPLTATEHVQQLETTVLFPIRHVRNSQTTLMSYVFASDELSAGDTQLTERRAAWRAGWLFSSAKQYGYSISQEDGGTFGATMELVREGLGASADAEAVTADARMYWSPFRRHHVIAVRAAGGVSSGDRVLRRTFHLGGAETNASPIDFGRNAISLLRGFGTDTFAGSDVALLNAEYRWPIARPQRGYGTWPFFVHTLHAAVFSDVGHAWTGPFRIGDVKSSAGAELSANLVIGYWFPLTATGGVAWGHDGSHVVRDGATVYARVGRSF